MRTRNHRITNPIYWDGRTQANLPVEGEIALSGPGGIGPVPGADGDVVYNDGGTLAAQPLWAFGYWTPITNGDPLSPEVVFDSAGACIVGFVPTP